MEQLIRLFKSVPIDKSNDIGLTPTFDPISTLRKGYILSNEVVKCYSEKGLKRVISQIDNELFLDWEKINATFQNSWDKIANANMEQLAFEQVVHYLTTYGFEELWIYNEATVYVPLRDFDIPWIDWIKITVIVWLNQLQIKEKLLNFLWTWIALSSQTVQDCVDVAWFCGISSIEGIKNKEVTTAMCEQLGIIPSDPVDFFRLIVKSTTWNTLLINNRKTFHAIREWADESTYKMLTKYISLNWVEPLARNFRRFKWLFMALRVNKDFKRSINHIRKISDTYHVPMKEDLLNSITCKLKNWEKIHLESFNKALSSANSFRKIRLANTLLSRMEGENVMYKIRNWKTFTSTRKALWKKVLPVVDVIFKSLYASLEEKIKWKAIYYPEWIEYALPVSEKEFIGNIPKGSYIECDKDMVFGIHWFDGNTRTDLDLSLFDTEWYKYWWDWRYRSGDKNILFSWDKTSAPKPYGAAELFYLAEGIKGRYMLYNASYSWENNHPFSLVVANTKIDSFQNYMLNPNDVSFKANLDTWDSRNSLIWLIDSTGVRNKLYLYWWEQNDNRASRWEYATMQREFIFNTCSNSIYMRELLKFAWAKFVTELSDADIDLSIEGIDKTTLINLIA